MERIEAQEIVLKSPNGKRSITLTAQDSTAGLWIESGEGMPMVAIYNNAEQICIGLYGPGRKSINVGLTVDKDGAPFIQFVDEKTGKICHFVPPELKG